MAKTEKYDVFLSYRREGGFEIATLLHDSLTRQGYRVFMDCQGLHSGEFDEQLYSVIDGVKDVVVILNTGALDRCVDEKDWLRMEVARAIAKKKNVIPVRQPEFTFPETLPPDIEALKTLQGVETSKELFRAYVERLKKLLKAKKHWTRTRLWKPMLATMVPILCVLIALGYFHLRQKARFEQVCKELAGVVGGELIKMNGDFDVLENAKAAWETFAGAMDKAPPQEQPHLAQNFLAQLAQLEGSLAPPLSQWPLTEEGERLLAENRQPTEDIRAFRTFDHREDVSGFLKQLEQLAKTPRQGWLANTRKVVELHGKMAQELMVGAYYSFLELLAGMPPGARAVFLQAKAFLTRFPAADPSWGTAEFKSLQERSLQRAGELEHDTALLIGGDGAVMDRVEKQLKELAKKAASGNQHVRGYAAAATRYYSAVLAKGLPAHGVLMVGTKDDRPHPVFQKGDVILERKGRMIRSADDYFALKDDPAPNVVRLIRFDDKGEPRFLNETLPASDVLVGFVDLWDTPRPR